MRDLESRILSTLLATLICKRQFLLRRQVPWDCKVGTQPAFDRRRNDTCPKLQPGDGWSINVSERLNIARLAH